MITVYLSGPMYKSKEECTTWRNETKKYLKKYCENTVSERVEKQREIRNTFYHFGGVHFPIDYLNKDLPFFNILDPCDRWFNTREEANNNSSWIVKIDKMEIDKADVLIVNASDNGWGTPMEQYMAYEDGKFVIAFCDKEFPSIWAKEHSHVMVRSHIEAAKWLCNHFLDIERTL